MKKLLIFLIILLPLVGVAQVAQDYTENSDTTTWLGTKTEIGAKADSGTTIYWADTTTLVATYTYVATNATQDGDSSSWLATKTNIADMTEDADTSSWLATKTDITTNAQQDADTTGFDATKTDLLPLQADADTTSWDATKTDILGLDNYFNLDGSIIYPSTSGDYLEMRKTGLAHGMTSVMTTSAFMSMGIADATDGGLEFRAIVNDVDNEGFVVGVGVNGDTPTTYPIQFQAGKKATTTWSPFAGDVPLIGFYNNTQQVMAFGSGGSMGIGSECEYKNHQLSLYDTDPSICLTDASINKVVNSVSASEDSNAVIIEANDTSPSIEFVNAIGNKVEATIDAAGDTMEFNGALEYQFSAVVSSPSIKTTGTSVIQLSYAYNIDGTIIGGPKIRAAAEDTGWKHEFAVPSQMDGESVIVDSIIVHFNTTVNESYIASVLLETDDMDGTGTTVVTYDTDIGNGSTGLTHTDILATDYTMVAGSTYWLLFTPVHNAATVWYHKE